MSILARFHQSFQAQNSNNEGGRDTQGGSNLTQCDLCRILPEKPILHFNRLDDENCIS